MLDFIIKGLAVWRISHMLVKEDGPKDILYNLRERTGIVHDEYGGFASWNDTTPLHCVFCTSVWVAFCLRFLPEFVINIFALSGIACLLEILNGKSDN